MGSNHIIRLDLNFSTVVELKSVGAFHTRTQTYLLVRSPVNLMLSHSSLLYYLEIMIVVFLVSA